MAKVKKVTHKNYPISESIGYLIGVTNRKLQPVLERYVRDKGVSFGTWFFLRTLWAQDHISPGELSKRVITSVPTTMAALGNLQRSGLVSIKDDPRDGRRLIVKLTAKGKKLEGVLLPRLAELNKTLMRGLNAREVGELRRMLRTIQANADHSNGYAAQDYEQVGSSTKKGGTK